MYKDWNIKDLNTIEKNGLNVFSCFSCCGGSSMGYKLAGYKVIGVNEIDPKLATIYKSNFPDTPILNISIQDMVKNKTYPKEIYGVDILDGSPPCSSFSIAGNREKDWGKDKVFREGQSKQVLDDLFFWFLKLAKDVRPKVIVAENVKGLVIGNAKGYTSKIFKEFELIGYNVQLFQLNSATMGVPQKRERVFFIASRVDLNMPKIELSFNSGPILYKDIKEKGDVSKVLTAHEEKLFNALKPSDKSLSDINMRTRGKNIGFSMHIINDNQVPNTLIAGGSVYSLSEKRHISIKEMIRIQSFPQDFDFMSNNYSHIKYILGMSVPPYMMRGIAIEIKKQLFKL